MDKYSSGLAITQNTSFPKCKALMIENSYGSMSSVVLHHYVSGSAGATLAATYSAKAESTMVVSLQCASIGDIYQGDVDLGIPETKVTALY